MAKERPITPKQQHFVDLLVSDRNLNATQAYMDAYGIKKESTAAAAAARLLTNVKVSRAIDEAKRVRSEATKIDSEYVLKRLHDENEADLADIYDKATGKLRPVHEWPLIWRKGLVQGVDVFEETDSEGTVIGIVRKVKISDRIKRTELIGKHVDVNAFKEQVEVSGTVSIAERIRKARERSNG